MSWAKPRTSHDDPLASHPQPQTRKRSRHESFASISHTPLPITRTDTKRRVPLKGLVVLLMVVFTAVPAIVLWRVSWQVGSDGIGVMQKTRSDSIEGISSQVRSLLIGSASNSIRNLVSTVEALTDHYLYRLNYDGLWGRNGLTIGDENVLSGYIEHSLYVLKSSPHLSMVGLFLYTNKTELVINGSLHWQFIEQTMTVVRMRMDIFTNVPGDTYYLAMLEPTESGNSSDLVYYFMDQNSGQRLSTIIRQPAPELTQIDVGEAEVVEHLVFEWTTDIVFNIQSGIPQIYLNVRIPFDDLEAAFDITLYANMYTVSALLKSLLMVGSLLGASHGKFFSHSEIDYSKHNPVFNPPPVAEFRTYSAINSTDQTIREAGEWILSKFQDWNSVPALDDVITIVGEPYWIVSAPIPSKYGVRLQLFLLVDRNSRMGPIEQANTNAVDDIDSTNRRLTIILCIVVVVVVILSVIGSLLLTRPLGRLEDGMNSLSLLSFEDQEDGFSKPHSKSHVLEISKCEDAFLALERALKAFVRYVPEGVVRLVVSGQMHLHSVKRGTVTVLFMDLARFSSLCDELPVDDLMKQTTDYFQAMCEVIDMSEGVLDKFIGDCIMALWNAPNRIEQHEQAACHAVCEMQTRLMDLCEKWTEAGLPLFRFRAGINTGDVLVGNVGCDYRVTFTCLGDGVNLASRLEGANKLFDTVVMVPQATRDAAHQTFIFRKLGKITVPGKSEILTVYELLCPIESKAPSSSNQGGGGGHLGDDKSDMGGGAGEDGLDRQSPTVTFSTASGNSGGLVVRPAPTPTSSSSLIPPSFTNSSIGLVTTRSMVPVLFHWNFVPRHLLMSLVDTYEKGLELYLIGNFESAARCFMSAKVICPTDGPSTLLLEHCRTYAVAAPSNWDGVIHIYRK